MHDRADIPVALTRKLGKGGGPGHPPARATMLTTTLVLLALLSMNLALAPSACSPKLEPGMETWCIMETEGASDDCELEESSPGMFFQCRGSVGLYDGDNACWESGEDCLPGEDCECEDEFSDDEAACDSIAISGHSVGHCGPLSIGGGDGGGADEQCRQSFKMKICTWQCAFGGDGYVGAVCVDKGYGEANGGPRPDLNLRPCEENPLTEGEPYICNTMIPGLGKPEYTGYEPDELNVSLLDCPEDVSKIAANYESMADFVETSIVYYENFKKFYTSLEKDLRNIYNAAKKQCTLCESSIEEFNDKYGGCALEVEIGDLPSPSSCFQTSKFACMDKEKCVEGNNGMSMCQSLCDPYPCNYGDNCDTHGVPRKPVGEKHECWHNDYFCGDNKAIGHKDDHGGFKGCDTGRDTVNPKGQICCCVRPCINEEFDPYGYMNAGCYRPNHIIAEAWRSLETKKAKNSRPSPRKIRNCAHELADLHDVCELDEVNGTRLKDYNPGDYAWPPPPTEGHHCVHSPIDFAAFRPPASQAEEDEKSYRTPCEVEYQLERILDYLGHMLKELPKMIGQLEAVRAKYQLNVEQGATYTHVQDHLEELAAIALRIDKFEAEDGKPDRIRSSDEFQEETTDMLLFLQNDKLLADLTTFRHNFPSEVSKFCSDVEIQDIHFPPGTNPHLKYKSEEEPPNADPHRQWAIFCRNYNVKECGKRPEDKEPGGMPPLPQPKPPVPGCGGYRGGCAPHEPAIANIKDINMDEWAEEHLDTLEIIRETDVEDVFVDTLSCLVHKIPKVSLCEDVCKKCYGTTMAHCHAQLELCVCRLGTEWRTTAYECADPTLNDTDRASIHACCEGMFADVYEPGPRSPIPWSATRALCGEGVEGDCPFNPELCESPSHALSGGPLFDRCQTARSPIGLCCRYGFDERPVTLRCMGSSSCRTACHRLFGSNRERTDACTRRCMGAKVACERTCVTQFPETKEARACVDDCWEGEGERDWPDTTFECILSCPRDERDTGIWDICARMCKALTPELTVSLATLRGQSEVQALYGGENVRFRADVANSGFLPFYGRSEVKLRLFDACDCPFCPEDAVCECSCEDLFSAIMATIPVSSVDPNTDVTLLSNLKEMDEDLVGKTVQPVLEVYDEQGRAIATAMGSISKVLPMGTVAVQDAWFTVDGERATKAHAGTRVKGTVTVKSALFPLTVSVSMVDSEGQEVPGSLASIMVMDVLEGSLLETREVDTPAEYVGFVLRLRVEAMDENNVTVFDQVLPEQGLPSESCSGEVMTFWCLEDALEFRMDYPQAYLEVTRPVLKVSEAGFETDGGLTSAVFYETTRVHATVDLSDIATVPFEGMVSVAVIDAWSLAVEGSNADTQVAIWGEGSTTVMSGPFMAEPGNSYMIVVRARDVHGREWAVEPTSHGIVNADLFPLARLEVREPTVVQGESVFIDHGIDYSGCMLRVSCNDCLPTCTLWLDRKKCLIRTDPGSCACECTVTVG